MGGLSRPEFCVLHSCFTCESTMMKVLLFRKYSLINYTPHAQQIATTLFSLQVGFLAEALRWFRTGLALRPWVYRLPRSRNYFIYLFTPATVVSSMNSRITESRIIWSSERPLSSCKQQLCLFARYASLPAPSRAVCTWYLHKRDQPNNASCCCQK